MSLRTYPSLTDQRDFFSKMANSLGETVPFNSQKSWAGLLLHPDGDMTIVPMKATDFNNQFVRETLGLTSYDELELEESPVLSLVFDIAIGGFYSPASHGFPNLSASNLIGFDIRGPVFLLNKALWEALQPEPSED